MRETNHIQLASRGELEGPTKRVKMTSKEIVFTEEDARGIYWPHNDTLQIRTLVMNVEIRRIMVDNGSSINVIYKGCYDQMGIRDEQLQPSPKPLYGFTGDAVIPIGQIRLPLTLRDAER